MRSPRFLLRLFLGIAVTLLPLVSTALLLRARHQAVLSDLLPVWVDDVLYWHQAVTFSAAGFNGGYYAVSEIPASAAFTHFNTWGPFTPALYGGVARLFSWTLYIIPVVNLVLLTVAIAGFLLIAGLGIAQLLLLGALLAVFIPLLLYATSSLQEVFQYAAAFALAAGFSRLLTANNRPSRRFMAGLLTLIVAAALIRVTWAFLLLPAFPLMEVRFAVRSGMLALLKGGLLLAALLVVYVVTSAPFPGALTNVMAQFRISPSAGFAALSANLSLNLNHLGQGDDLEIRLRLLVGLLCLACLALGVMALVRRKIAPLECFIHLKQSIFCVFVLVTIAVFVVVIYDVKDWRDFRMFAPPLLLVLALLVVFNRRLLIGGVIVVLALQVPYALTIYDIWTGYHLDAPKRDQFYEWREPLATVLTYNSTASNPWCNTVLHSAYYIFGPTSVLLAVDPGIGLSSPLLEGEWHFPPKARYLLLDNDTYTTLADKLHVEPLLDVPDGKLYRNLDAACP